MHRIGNRSRSATALLALGFATVIGLAGCVTPYREPSPSPDGPIVGSAAATVTDEETVESLHVAALPVSVTILYSGSVPTHTAIATLIGEGLSGYDYTIRRTDIDRSDMTASIDAESETRTDIVAAIGPGALDVARERFVGAEIVFSQVLDPELDAGEIRNVRGVAPMPPPTVQLAAWAEVDAHLKRIGLITSASFAQRIASAEQAAAAIGAELQHRVSTSDRETLYLFRRLASDIDGLWLAPDSEILSSAIIDEMLAYAAELNIGVLVFSENLLERGGLISVGAPPEHVAETVIDAIERIRAGQGSCLPTEIDLVEAVVQVNARVATDLGLASEMPTEWFIDSRK